MPTQIVREVMREYEYDRDKAALISRNRLNEAYERLPRVKEIDAELSMLGISASKGIISGDGDTAGLVSHLSNESKRLVAEKDTLLKNAGFTADFFTNVYKCAACGDTGYTGGEVCGCFKRRLIAKFYEMSNLSGILKRENFDTFNINHYSNETDPKTGVSPRANMNRVWTAALNFVKNFDTEFNNLLLYGDTGLGKTFLCNCIAKELLDAGKTVIYVTSPQLFKMVESIRFDKDSGDEPEQFMEMVFSSDLLIIDDLGTEISTVVTASELFNIINTRLLNRRHTIISTNFSPPEYADIYSDRITSRLFGNYLFLKFFGDDIRLKIRYKM